MKQFTVKEQGERLDKVIANKCEELSRTMIQKLIEEKKILVNGKVRKSFI